jgi:hypothetical protein
MFLLQLVKRGDDGLRLVAHRSVTANEIRVEIDQPRRAPLEAACPVQIKENGAAADERLQVAMEGGGVVPAQGREELALPASPFQQRPHGWGGRFGTYGHSIGASCPGA